MALKTISVSQTKLAHDTMVTSRIIRISLVGRTRASCVPWLVWLSPPDARRGARRYRICLRISYLIQGCNHTVL